MFKLISRYKNEIIKTDSENKRDRLIDLGYTLVEEKTDFKKMKAEEIDTYAKEKGIDLSMCNNKAEKLEKIKNSIQEQKK